MDRIGWQTLGIDHIANEAMIFTDYYDERGIAAKLKQSPVIRSALHSMMISVLG